MQQLPKTVLKNARKVYCGYIRKVGKRTCLSDTETILIDAT